MPDLQLLRESYPEAPAVPRSSRDRARVELQALVARAERSPRRSLRERWLAPAAGAAAAVAVAAGVFLVLETGGGEEASAAETVLRNTAVVARAQPPLRLPRRGEYLYIRSENAYLTTSVYSERLSFSVLVPRVREIWLGRADGRLRQTSGAPRFLSSRDRAAWVAAGRPPLAEPATDQAMPGLEPLALPSEPDALFERLEREAAGHPEGVAEQMFTLIGDALRETTATPAQRAALYEVAARLDGVELVGRVTDPAGRRGVAVAMRHGEDGIRQLLVFDPDTAALLAEEQRTLADNAFGYPAGTLVGYATYVRAGLVDSVRERPPTR